MPDVPDMFFQLREVLDDLLYVRGVFHLDVKLENCLINPTSIVVKICDFGLAKVVRGSPDYAYTGSWLVLGCITAPSACKRNMPSPVSRLRFFFHSVLFFSDCSFSSVQKKMQINPLIYKKW